DDDIKQWTHQFYTNDGPRRIVEIWSHKLHRHKDWDSSFVNSAVDVVVWRTKRDLNRYKNDVIGDNDLMTDEGPAPAYRMPHNKVKEKNIDQFLSDGFLNTYASHASFLMRLLDGVLYKNKNKNKNKSKGNNNNGNKHKHMSGEDEDTEDEEVEEDGEDVQDEDEEDDENTATAKEHISKGGAVVRKRGRSPSS
ncbi:hypothetical protein BGX26_009140, partial [Mortierella sp. AD094]